MPFTNSFYSFRPAFSTAWPSSAARHSLILHFVTETEPPPSSSSISMKWHALTVNRLFASSTQVKSPIHWIHQYEGGVNLRLFVPDKFKIYERLCSLSHNSVPEMRKNLAGLEKNLKKSSKQNRETVQQYKIRLKAMEKENYVDEELVNKLKIDDDSELKVKQ